MTNTENSTPKIILIVDDVAKNLQVLGNVLIENGYEVALANSGKRALSVVQNTTPDLILLDVMMPEMDGYEVCTKLKANSHTSEIPVIFLTARTDSEDIVKGLKCGAVDYVSKPFNATELLTRVHNHLELKQSRDLIVTYNQKLKELDEEKNEFLGIAAHDLKNPLSTILMLGKYLHKNSELTREEIADFANDIITTADRMLELVKTLLDVNAIEQGNVKVAIETVGLSAATKSIFEVYSAKAEKKNITLNLESAAKEVKVLADKNALIQVLENLISNAVKYTPSHKNIFISIETSEKNAVVKVRDEGPGISPQDQKKLFGRFAKLSAQPTGGESSTGLGLSIVKKLVQDMNGEVWCESVVGHGATFCLRLPLAS